MRPGKGLGEEDGFGILPFDLVDDPLPEREGLCMRIVYPEDAHALIDPELENALQFLPQRRVPGTFRN